MPRRTLVSLLALLALASSCAREDRPTGTEPPGSSPLPTASAPASHSPGASDAPRARAPLGGTPAPDPPPPGAAARSFPPEPGTYRYDQQSVSRFGTLTFQGEPRGTLQVDRAVLARGGQRQRQLRRYSSDSTREQILLFTDDAVLLEESTSRFPGGEIRCRTPEPLTLMRLPVLVGQSWRSSGECDETSLTIGARVVRQEERSVGSERVETFLVRYVIDLVREGFTSKTTASVWVSPEHRLVVRATEHSEGTFQGTTYAQDSTEQLTSLEPA